MNIMFPKSTEITSYDELFDALIKLGDQVKSLLNDLGLYHLGDIKILRSRKMYCYYELNSKNIYLSLPSEKTPNLRLVLALYKDLLKLKSDDELFSFIHSYMPFVVFHEIAHFLRDANNKMTNNLWYEEQVANRLASSLYHLLMDERETIDLVKNLTQVVMALGKKEGGDHWSNIVGDEKMTSFDQVYTQNLEQYFCLQVSWALIDIQHGENKRFSKLQDLFL